MWFCLWFQQRQQDRDCDTSDCSEVLAAHVRVGTEPGGNAALFLPLLLLLLLLCWGSQRARAGRGPCLLGRAGQGRAGPSPSSRLGAEGAVEPHPQQGAVSWG